MKINEEESLQKVIEACESRLKDKKALDESQILTLMNDLADYFRLKDKIQSWVNSSEIKFYCNFSPEGPHKNRVPFDRWLAHLDRCWKQGQAIKEDFPVEISNFGFMVRHSGNPREELNER